MKDKDQKYKELICRIRVEKPKLDDPQIMTLEILSAVGKLPNKTKLNRSLKLVSWISSTVAVLFLGLFFSEQLTSSAPHAKNIGISNYRSFLPTELNIEEGLSLDEINNIIRKKREFRKARETLYANIINKHQPF